MLGRDKEKIGLAIVKMMEEAAQLRAPMNLYKIGVDISYIYERHPDVVDEVLAALFSTTMRGVLYRADSLYLPNK